MSRSQSVALALLALASCTSLAVVAYALARWRRRRSRSVALLAVLLVATAMWSVGEFLLWAPWTDATTGYWHWLLYPAHLGLPVAWVLFALQFAGFERYVTRRTVAGLTALPAVTLVVVWVDSLSHLYVGSVGHQSLSSATLSEYGPLFYLSTAYNYFLILVGLWVLLRFAGRSSGIYRGQVAAIVVAAVAPLITNVYLLFRTVPIEANVTPIAFAVSGLALCLAVFRYRFLDVVPIARRSIVEHMRDGIVVTDGDGRIVDVNRAARTLLDAGGACPVGADAAAVRLGDRSIDSLVGDDEVELTVETPDGPRYVAVRSIPLGRTIAGDLLVLRDVTERRSTEHRYRTFVENASDIVTVLGLDGTIRYQSPAVESVLGYRPEEIVGDVAFEYVHPSDRERIVEQFSASRSRENATIRTEYRMRHADGGWRIVESTGRNLIDDPAVEGIVVTSRDVTERRRRERELERTNERLDEFAGVVSHDLRNPLSTAQGYLGLLEDRVDDDDAIAVIREHHARMEAIIDDALELARTGAVVDETEAVELETVARLAWANVETEGARLAVADSRVLRADRDRLLRAFENLFRNSVEHGTPEGRADAALDDGAVPEVGRGSSVSPPGSRRSGDPRPEDGPSESRGSDDSSLLVEVGTTADGFYVADDGPGIPPGLRDRLFEPGVSSSGDGTGLGLSIVSRIARAHGWDVEAIADADGARFEFRLDGEEVPAAPADGRVGDKR